MRSRSYLKSAELSECGRYRWWLQRKWPILSGDPLRIVTFVMLNPSTADATFDDPTIRRCIGFAKAWGFEGVSVRNLFAYRATKPSELLVAENPTGGSRGDGELSVAATADLLVVAWGASVPFGRDREAVRLFGCREMYCLGRCKNGNPRHPLYVSASVKPERWEVAGPLT